MGWFAPSPDGRFLADTGKDPKRTDILYIQNLHTGKNIRSIELKVHNFFDISWSPDGAWIAYSGNEFGRDAGWEEDTKLYLVSPDGKQHIRLPDAADQRANGLVWAANSQSLFYNAADTGKPEEIWEVSIDSKQDPKLHKPFHAEATFFSRYPFYTFSPNGEEIAYASLNDGLFVANVDGTNRRKVIDNKKFEFFFQVDWSPNGQNLVFSAGNGKISFGLYTYSFATDTVEELLFTGEKIPGWHQWVNDALAVNPTNKMATVWSKLKKIQQFDTNSFVLKER